MTEQEARTIAFALFGSEPPGGREQLVRAATVFLVELGAQLADAGWRVRLERLSYTCPACGRTSYHPEDVKQRYCGACHVFGDEPRVLEQAGDDRVRDASTFRA